MVMCRGEGKYGAERKWRKSRTVGDTDWVGEGPVSLNYCVILGEVMYLCSEGPRCLKVVWGFVTVKGLCE